MKSISLAIWLLIAASCFGQSYQDGYVVLNTGDTLRGEIENGNWTNNPVAVIYKSAGSKQKYEVSSLKAFGITGEARFERFLITYQESADDLAEATETFDGPVTTKEVWLRLLYQEKYSLYELITPKRKYFFVRSEKDGLKELIYRVKVYNNQMEKDEQYKNLLLSYAIENNRGDIVQKNLSVTDYKNKDLLKIFSLLNNGKKGFEDNKKSHSLFDLTLGASVSSFKTSGNLFNDGSGSYAVHTSTFKGSAGILAGLGVTFLSNGSNSRFQPRVGLNFRTLKLDGENNTGAGSFEKEKYTGSLVILEPNINLLINLSKNEKNRFLLGPYFGYNLVLSENFASRFENPGVVIERDNFPPSNGGYLFGGIDLSFIGNFGKINLQYALSSNIFDSPFTVLKVNSFTLSYGYILNKGAKRN
jgi:hypothetical protein